jgi:putative chitinase
MSESRTVEPTKGAGVMMHGSDVRWVQKRLGPHHHPVTVDGYCGAETAAAVTAFQKDTHLEPDGAVGPHTWKALSHG